MATGCFGEEQGGRADEQRVFRARGTDPTGVTQIIFHPSWAETSAFTALFSPELPTTIAQGARAERKAI